MDVTVLLILGLHCLLLEKQSSLYIYLNGSYYGKNTQTMACWVWSMQIVSHYMGNVITWIKDLLYKNLNTKYYNVTLWKACYVCSMQTVMLCSIINATICNGPNPIILGWFWFFSYQVKASSKWVLIMIFLGVQSSYSSFSPAVLLYSLHSWVSNYPSEDRWAMSFLTFYVWLCRLEKAASPHSSSTSFQSSFRENQSLCLFLGGSALYFLFCVPSTLETSLIFCQPCREIEE